MAQIFHPGMNALARISVFGAPLLVVGVIVTGAIIYRSGYITGRGEVIDQPVPFSHLHHVGQLGIDCRYCHTAVETSSFAGIPPTKTCMNCHQQMWAGSEMLNPIRESYKQDKSVPWERVHNLPDYAYFNHSIHIAKGVGCVSCHGQVNEMPLLFQSKTLLMEWCLQCHRAPEKHLRPKSEVFSTTWLPEKGAINPDTGEEYPKNQKELGAVLKEQYKVRNALTLTSCSICHR
jgi:Cytochrome c7 and related cytochrome c